MRAYLHCVTVFLLSVCAPVFSSLGAETPSFDAQVLPILQKRCLACHSGAGAQAGLDLSTREGALKGGRSGLAIHPGAGGKSLLVEKIVSHAMPPTEPKLTDGEIAAIRQWIDKGNTGKASQSVTEADVLPIFQMRCVVCHGKRKQEGGLDLRSLASQLKGGKTGAAIVLGKPEESLLIQRIVSGQMPPPKLLVEYFVRPPSDSEVDMLRKWIAGGAAAAPKQAASQEDQLVGPKDREFWAFQPSKRPGLPRVNHPDLVRNPIDAFLLQKLEEKQLSYSSAADRVTSIAASMARSDGTSSDAR